MMAGQDRTPASAVLFETNDGKHFLLFAKDGRVQADGGVRLLMALTEKEMGERIDAEEKSKANGGQ